MNSRFPSFQSLRAFEAAARLGSFKAAADALCVTPSALSKRILALEEELGQDLFLRDARKLRLTQPGARYAQSLQEIFEALSQATQAACGDTEQADRQDFFLISNGAEAIEND